VSTVFWETLTEAGAELCRLDQTSGGYVLAGTVLTTDGGPAAIVYRIELDAEWQTRRVRLTRDGESALELEPARAPWPDGCADVDLELSPSTNTLPIRRLSLALGDSAEISAAWVRYPSLAVERARQRYTRLAERVYRFESGGGFEVELEVDEDGLVLDYPGYWRRA
jgi:hypothetical protein